MKIYISGKITGIEAEAKMLFNEVEKHITLYNHLPINPLNLNHSQHNKSWYSYMRVCLAAMMDADAIVMLSNWKESRGACFENEIALRLKMKIYNTVDEMLAQLKEKAEVCDATTDPQSTTAGNPIILAQSVSQNIKGY